MYGFNDDRSKVNAEDVVATNWVNGSQDGSVRTVGSNIENSEYTIGQYAVAEGSNTKASGPISHAEGNTTVASGSYSHAEGRSTVASGSNSHAEGAFTAAVGNCSHAEGYNTVAKEYSHAEGNHTIASGYLSHVQGTYNIEDPTAYTKTTDTSIISGKKYYTLSNGRFYEVSSPAPDELSSYYEYTPANAEQAFIIGNGTNNADRSNAYVVNRDGTVYSIKPNMDMSIEYPSEDIDADSFCIKDKNSINLGGLGAFHATNGGYGISIIANNKNGQDPNALYLYRFDSGDPYVFLSHPTAWLAALGLNVTTYSRAAFGFSTGFTHYADTDADMIYAEKFGRVVVLHGAYKCTTAQSSAADIVIGQVPIGCEPTGMVRVVCQGSGQNRFALEITPNRNLKVRRYGIDKNIAIPANSWLNIHCTYISAS